jgi:glycosyltransferase involved in cell wall biosynthesis
MRLLIISHTPHYYDNDTMQAWGATVREIDFLALYFDEVVHIAPIHQELSPDSSLAYQAKNIRICPVSPSGGETIRNKFAILLKIPEYIYSIVKEMKTADIVHVRSPSNISLVALFLLIFNKSSKVKWVKYAGNWHPTEKEAWSYTLQRWILQNNLHRGVVTVNGHWPRQPNHVHSFINPCLTQSERDTGIEVTRHKKLTIPYHLLFVGRLDSAKGVDRTLDICAKLQEKKLPFRLDLVGDGPKRRSFELLASELEISEKTHFHGWLPRFTLNQYYSDAHFIIFPSTSSEGWPKVLSEAMAYGVVPIASNVSSIPQILRDAKAGYAFSPNDIDHFVQAISDFSKNPSSWKSLSHAAVAAAGNFTYENYITAVKKILESVENLEKFHD